MSKKELRKFKVEVTDTFGGEANYCWVRRYEFVTVSELGAIQALGREYGGNWRSAGHSGRYDMKGAHICCFVEEVA